MYIILLGKKEKKGGYNMPFIRPITDLKNTTEISELCHTKREPVYITKNGYGDLVIMSIKAYKEMLETALTDTAISEAEKEFASSNF